MSGEIIEAIKKIISDKKIILQKDLISEVQKSGLASHRNAKKILIENEGKFWFTHNLNKNSKYYSLDKELNLSDSELDKIINANFYDFIEIRENKISLMAIFLETLKDEKFEYQDITYTKFCLPYHHNINEFFKNQKFTKEQVRTILFNILSPLWNPYGFYKNPRIRIITKYSFESCVKYKAITELNTIETLTEIYNEIDNFLKTNTFENFIYPEI